MEGDKASHYLTHETREELLFHTLTEITRLYYELAAERLSEVSIFYRTINIQKRLVSTLCALRGGNMLQARKTENFLQKSRQNAQKRAGGTSGVADHNVSGTEKMCMQLLLDLQVTLLMMFHCVL